jgi:hypothetical protein
VLPGEVVGGAKHFSGKRLAWNCFVKKWLEAGRFPEGPDFKGPDFKGPDFKGPDFKGPGKKWWFREEKCFPEKWFGERSTSPCRSTTPKHFSGKRLA